YIAKPFAFLDQLGHGGTRRIQVRRADRDVVAVGDMIQHCKHIHPLPAHASHPRTTGNTFVANSHATTVIVSDQPTASVYTSQRGADAGVSDLRRIQLGRCCTAMPASSVRTICGTLRRAKAMASAWCSRVRRVWRIMRISPQR